MRTYWIAKMKGKYFHRGLYEYYPQRPVRFVDFLANPTDQTYFFKESSFYVYYFLLVISLFVKVNIFPQVLQMWYLTSCILWYFNFAQVAKRNQLSLGEQIATQMEQCLKCLVSNLSYYIYAATIIPVPDLSVNSNCFSDSNSNCFCKSFA